MLRTLCVLTTFLLVTSSDAFAMWGRWTVNIESDPFNGGNRTAVAAIVFPGGTLVGFTCNQEGEASLRIALPLEASHIGTGGRELLRLANDQGDSIETTALVSMNMKGNALVIADLSLSRATRATSLIANAESTIYYKLGDADTGSVSAAGSTNAITKAARICDIVLHRK